MTRKSGERRFTRRNVLKQVGVGVASVGAISSAATGSAAAEVDGEGPLYATGTYIDRYIPDGDTFRYEERFVSNELVDRYGKATVEFETESVLRERIPDEYKNPDRAFVRKYEDTAVLGAPEEHYAAEEKERERRKADSSGGFSTASHTPVYLGPLYVYKSGSTDVRKGPINVGWRRYLGFNAYEVNQKMYQDASWDGGLPMHDRYVIHEGGWTEKQDQAVAKPTGIYGEQYHDRLWTLPNYEDDDYSVVAQAHYDCAFHSGCNWKFADARRYNLKVWRKYINGFYSTDNWKIYNGSGYQGDQTSNGYLGVVY